MTLTVTITIQPGADPTTHTVAAGLDDDQVRPAMDAAIAALAAERHALDACPYHSRRDMKDE